MEKKDNEESPDKSPSFDEGGVKKQPKKRSVKSLSILVLVSLLVLFLVFWSLKKIVNFFFSNDSVLNSTSAIAGTPTVETHNTPISGNFSGDTTTEKKNEREIESESVVNQRETINKKRNDRSAEPTTSTTLINANPVYHYRYAIKNAHERSMRERLEWLAKNDDGSGKAFTEAILDFFNRVRKEPYIYTRPFGYSDVMRVAERLVERVAEATALRESHEAILLPFRYRNVPERGNAVLRSLPFTGEVSSSRELRFAISQTKHTRKVRSRENSNSTTDTTTTATSKSFHALASDDSGTRSFTQENLEVIESTKNQ